MKGNECHDEVRVPHVQTYRRLQQRIKIVLNYHRSVGPRCFALFCSVNNIMQK